MSSKVANQATDRCVSLNLNPWIRFRDSILIATTFSVNAAGFAIHSALHAARGDINAAAHAHSRYGKAFSALGRNLDIANYGGHSDSHFLDCNIRKSR